MREADFRDAEWSKFTFYDHPPIGKYIFGLALELFRHKRITNAGGVHDWHRTWLLQSSLPELTRLSSLGRVSDADYRRLMLQCRRFTNQLLSERPPRIDKNDLKVLRAVSWCFGIMTGAMLLCLCWSVTKEALAGLVAALLFLNNPVTIPCFQQAMADSVCWFFATAAVVAQSSIFKTTHELSPSRSQAKTVGIAIIEGVLIGLALGTKLVTVSVPICVALTYAAAVTFSIVGVDGRVRLKRCIGRQALLLFLIGAISTLVFIVSNPFLLRSPLRNVIAIFEYRRTMIELQSLTQPAGIVDSTDKLIAIVQHGILLGFNLNRWALPLLVGLCFAIMGIEEIARRCQASYRKRRIDSWAVFAIWIASTFVVTSIGIHMVQNRYFVPYALCTCAIVGIGVGRTLEMLQLSQERTNALKALSRVPAGTQN